MKLEKVTFGTFSLKFYALYSTLKENSDQSAVDTAMLLLFCSYVLGIVEQLKAVVLESQNWQVWFLDLAKRIACQF